MTLENLKNNDPFAEADEQPNQVKSPDIVKSPDSAKSPNLAKSPDVKSPKDANAILNLAAQDPFAEEEEEAGQVKKTQEYIHIRIQQRNGRKSLTTVQGLPKKFDQKRILKAIKKKFACNGTIVTDEVMGEVIQLQGDQRNSVREFLIDKIDGLGLKATLIQVHGF